MGDTTSIEWTESTWNPIAGCSVLSPGCTNCYAMKMAARIEAMQAALGKPTPYAGLTQRSKAGPVWNGRVAVAPDETLTQPLRWKRPRRIFVNSMSDLFHEGVADETIDRVFAVMALSPQHTFQVLTKRAARMREYLRDLDMRNRVARVSAGLFAGFDGATCKRLGVRWNTLKPWPLSNVWLGVSAEDQPRADERIPHLLATPAAKRFISAEPLLGAIDLTRIDIDGHSEIFPLKGTPNCEDDDGNPMGDLPRLDWVIAGGESGKGARPMHPDWVRSLRDQCAAAEVPFFFKQWGEWGPLNTRPPKESHAIANDGTLYRTADLAYPDGARYGEAIRKDHDKASLHTTYCVGKRAAGALLDGREHREFPA